MKKYINQLDMKMANAADIFSLIRKRERITRKEIEAETGFSWGAVSTITAQLIEKNYIREFKLKVKGGAGRIPSYLEVNGDDFFVLGVDINISGFKAVVLNLKNEAAESFCKKAVYTDCDSLLGEIINFVSDTLSSVKNKKIIGIGVAMQGLVDAKNGISVNIPHCRSWDNVPLSQILRDRFDIPVFIEHDPDCVLYSILAEDICKDAILFRVDEGIGMSVLLDGKIFNRQGAFEVGHTVSVPDGVLCSCGKQGCLEAYASENGMARLAGKSFEKLVESAKSKDRESLRLFSDMAKYLAVAVSNMSNILCIDKIVLCGDMWKYKDLFYNEFLYNVKSLSGKTNMEFSFIDVENAAIGAALIAIERSIKIIDFGKDV
ncbi:MAG: ROK family transcriptional regulator [Ruminococcaceae bacterium]|nr:ROK family transcriptional regulator [Oscillospiraceae bacterium]